MVAHACVATVSGIMVFVNLDICAFMKMKKIVFLLLMFCSMTLFVCADNRVNLTLVPASMVDGGTIVVTDAYVNEHFEGNGFHFSPYPIGGTKESIWGRRYGAYVTDEKWELICKRLDYMQPQTVRVMMNSQFHYLGTSPMDYDYQIEVLAKFLNYCKTHGVTVIFGEFEPPSPYKVDSDNWVTVATGFVRHLVDDLGYDCIKYYTVVNEPDGDWSAVKGDWNVYKRCVEKFYAKFAEVGLDDRVAVIGPDAVPRWTNGASQYNGQGWMEQSYKQLDGMLGAYVLHDYPNRDNVLSGSGSSGFYEQCWNRVKAAGKPLFIGELGYKYPSSTELYAENIRRAKVGHANQDDCNMFVYDYFYGIDMAAVTMQAMNAGIAGCMPWLLDDAMHTDGNGSLNKLKKWGFWNILGKELFDDAREEDVRPWFYTMSLLTRYFPRGTKIRQVEMPKGAETECVVGERDGAVMLALNNHSFEDRRFTVKMPSALSTEPLTLSQYTYSDGHRPVDEDQFPVVDKVLRDMDFTEGAEIVVPAFSFILLTSEEK